MFYWKEKSGMLTVLVIKATNKCQSFTQNNCLKTTITLNTVPT